MGRAFLFISVIFTLGFSSCANGPVDVKCVKLMEQLNQDRLRARFAGCMERRGADGCQDRSCYMKKQLRCTEYMFGFQYRTLKKLRISKCYQPQA